MAAMADLEQRLGDLWSGVDLLDQQVTKGNRQDPNLRGQCIQLYNAITHLQVNVMTLLSSAGRESESPEIKGGGATDKATGQQPFKPVAPTPKGKLLQIIESLKRASTSIKKSPQADALQRSVSVDAGSPVLNSGDVMQCSLPPCLEALDIRCSECTSNGSVCDDKETNSHVRNGWTNNDYSYKKSQTPVLLKLNTVSEHDTLVEHRQVLPEGNENDPLINNIPPPPPLPPVLNEETPLIITRPVPPSSLAAPLKRPAPPLPPRTGLVAPSPPPVPAVIPPPPPIGPVAPPPPTVCPAPQSSVDRYKPNLPLKPLFWKRVQFSSAELRKTKNIWKQISEPALFNMDLFEESFAKRQSSSKNMSHSQSVPLVPHRSHVRPITLLNGKRSQAVGILLRSLSYGVCDISEAVRSGDVSLVDRETLQAIYDMQATKDELSVIKAHLDSDQPRPLDRPEMFLYELSAIPQFNDRLFCLLSTCSIPETHTSLHSKMATFRKVVYELIHSKEVASILSIILALGNAMNSGNKVRGQADGFHIEILPKLRDVKTSDNTSNLLHYLTAYYVGHVEKAQYTEIFPLPDPSDLMSASQMDFELLNEEVDVLSQQFKAVKGRIKIVLKASSRETVEPFKTKMENFSAQTDKDVASLKSLLQSCENEFQSLVSYYCVAPPTGQGSVDPGYFFSQWCPFVIQFREFWKKEKRSQALERKRAEEVKRKNGALVKPVSNSGLKSRIKTKRNCVGV